MAQEYAKAGAKNHLENIAIVGASGTIGKWIVSALLKTGKQKITAITREGSTNTMPSRVIVKKVDYDNHAALVEILKRQDALVITMNVMAAPDTQNKLIEAAAEAKVPWVLPNEWGSGNHNEEAGKDVMLGPMHKAVRDKIEELGVSSWTGIACGFWYEFSLAGMAIRYGFDFPNKTVTFYDDGNTKISTSTWPQTGLAASKLLNLPLLPTSPTDTTLTLSHYRNKFAYISSFTISQKDMFDSVLRVTSTQAPNWKITYEPVKERFEKGKEMMQAGNRVGFGQMLYARAFFPDGVGNFETVPGLENERLGLEKEDLDEFTGEAVKLVESGYFRSELRGNENKEKSGSVYD